MGDMLFPPIPQTASLKSHMRTPKSRCHISNIPLELRDSRQQSIHSLTGNAQRM